MDYHKFARKIPAGIFVWIMFGFGLNAVLHLLFPGELTLWKAIGALLVCVVAPCMFFLSLLTIEEK